MSFKKGNFESGSKNNFFAGNCVCMIQDCYLEIYDPDSISIGWDVKNRKVKYYI